MAEKVLLIGNGAREHAMAKKIVENENKLFSYMAYENPGIADISEKFILGNLTNFEKLSKFENIDYAIIGPELPLSFGLTNYIEDKLEIPVASPRQEVAKIETSKSFARNLLEKYEIEGNPVFKICKTISDFESFVKENGLEIAIKPDGLTGGKAVKVFGDHFSSYSEAEEIVKQTIAKDGLVIIEKKVKGKEFSLQVFTDGKNIQLMPLVRDYKRAYEGDKGPNTGSMGSYSLPDHHLPFLKQNDVEKAVDILKKTIKALKEHTNIPYVGVLYGQFMKSERNVFLIEFNARFGDPEAINVLKLLKDDYNVINQNMIDQSLKKVNFENKATVCNYLVPKGYPINPLKDEKITISYPLKSDLFYASVYRENGTIRTTTSRSLALLGVGNDIFKAKRKVIEDITKIKGKLYWRTDIGELE
ncbi:MAG: phosphoribosylamine--glycine ligase [Candidatus Heimdallarchaeum aukensis]|uniref:phosphoribosylamine--glycine ligase n=1 Tax=Candidatus Heimdallarchaeum aukensis TaxID=2876573 RepID=A0A9Y1BN79_9ARCH|nr:MAG: phosphoribosylamine--glycine ligase [Candidatus Heimdallarchaeum aukensis]